MYAISSEAGPGGAYVLAPEVEGPSVELRREPVGKAEFRREDLQLLAEGRVMVLAQAFGPPRLWGYLLDSALDAFSDGFLRAPEGTPMSLQLHHGHRAASYYVRTRVEALIERRGADVGLLAIALDGFSLHVLAAGPLDAYLHRRKAMWQLGQPVKEDGAEVECLVKGTPGSHVEHVEPGDLLFAGSRRVCDSRALAGMSSALEQDRGLSARAAAAQLAASATERRLGAAVVACRIPANF